MALTPDPRLRVPSLPPDGLLSADSLFSLPKKSQLHQDSTLAGQGQARRVRGAIDSQGGEHTLSTLQGYC